MLDTVFNALPVVDDNAAALALEPSGAGTPFLFKGANARQQPVDFFENNRADGNRITYFLRIPGSMDIPPSSNEVGYTRIFDTLECDPLGMYPPSGCGTVRTIIDPKNPEIPIISNEAAYVLGDTTTPGTNIYNVDGSLPEFNTPPPSATACVC